MALKITLDHGGIAEVLQSAGVRRMVDAAAADVANTVRAADTVQRHGAPVVVDHYTTDRAAASVTIAHAGGRGMEAKYGTLTGAARAAGLSIGSHS